MVRKQRRFHQDEMENVWDTEKTFCMVAAQCGYEASERVFRERRSGLKQGQGRVLSFPGPVCAAAESRPWQGGYWRA